MTENTPNPARPTISRPPFQQARVTTGYYADGEPSDGWHWFVQGTPNNGERILSHGGPHSSEDDARRAGERALARLRHDS